MNEEKALLLSSIPDSIWKKYKLHLSPSAEYLWSGSKTILHFKIEALKYVFIDKFDVCLNTGNSFVLFTFKGKEMHFYFT